MNRGSAAVTEESTPASETMTFSPRRTGRHAASAPDVPRQLPASVPHFTGRAAELEALTEILDEAISDSLPGALVISAIGGTAGIGKTALALRWAHQVAGRFPDGQLHVNLRGFDPSGVPMDPADAVCGFLSALGVPAESIPRDADGQAGLYRSVLAGRRMLIVLDNARDEQQVRPLLPASAGSLVLVTSRNQITGLAAAEGARLITLGTLTHAEAVRMLITRVGKRRAATDAAAVSEIATLCACLPLALSVASARINARLRFPLSALTAELRDTPQRLDALNANSPGASIQSVFSWSYEQLSPEAARMFRLLGLHPGPDISAAAAARLADTDEASARDHLSELDAGCLITEHAPGRYAFHDLLRAYAANQARTADGQPEINAALGRILGYYAQTACAAALALYPSREMMTFSAAQPAQETRFDDAPHARAWLEAEHANLVASVTSAAEHGFDQHAWQLPWFLATYLSRSSYWNERIALQRTAIASADRLGDVTGQAVSRRLLGSSYLDLESEHGKAMDCFKASADFYKQAGDRLGEAKAAQRIATVGIYEGRYAEATAYLQRALRLQRELGHRAGEAKTLIILGMVSGADGDMSRPLEFARQALALSEEIGNRYIEEFAWHNIGYCHQVLNNHSEAVTNFHRALDLARKAGDRFHEADILAHLGDVHHTRGGSGDAENSWTRALIIFDEIGHPDADHVRAKLASPGPSGSDLSVSLPITHVPTSDAGVAPFPRCSLVHRSPETRPASDTIQLRRPGV